MAEQLQQFPMAGDAPIDKATGRLKPHWYKALNSVFKVATAINNDVTSLNESVEGTTSETGGLATLITNLKAAVAKEELSATFQFPVDGDTKVVANGLFKRTINAVTTVTTAGTATVTIKIGSTALGGSANSASTSEQTQDHESANVMEVGDDLTIAFASTSSDCENCVVSIHATKDLS